MHTGTFQVSNAAAHGSAESEQMQHSHDSDVLEVAYQKSCQDVATVYVDESERRFRVQKMLLEHDREDLQAKVQLSENRVEDLTLHEKELQECIDSLTLGLEAARGDVRIRSREVEALKVE